MCVYIVLHSIKKYILKNIYKNETDEFSHSKAKWTYFFINILIDFNSYVKEIKKTLLYQLAN